MLFVDASLDCSTPFAVREPSPRRDSSISSHALLPEALLQVFAHLQGHAPPPATVLAIRGEAFALGAPMTAAAQAHMAAALRWGPAWLEPQG